jgi:hypothetical protein
VWYFRYRRNGNEVAVRIGAFPTEAAARREVDRLGLREQANAPLKSDRAPLQSILQCVSYGDVLKKSANGFGLGTPTPVTSSQPGAVFR